MAVKNKVVRHAIFFAGALSLISLPAFAGEHYGDHEKGKMGEKEMPHRWFQKMDRDGDGKISADEFQEATEKKFEHLDRDGDGSITQEEWQAAAEEWREKHRKRHYQHNRGERESSEEHTMEGM